MVSGIVLRSKETYIKKAGVNEYGTQTATKREKA